MELMPIDKSQQLLEFVKNNLESIKAENITILPVEKITSITNYMVIATGTSTIHVRSIADRLIERAKAEKIPMLSSEGQRQAEWILVDLGDVIVHVMQETARDYYHLEKLWSVIEEEA
jgi:ribosome-associated protein